VKLAPANQTFIAAADPGQHGRALISALRTVGDGSVLKRVTIVAARQDDEVVVLHADYAAESGITPKALAHAPSAASRGSAYLSPIEQYARTQQGGGIAAAPLLDVRA
jgi:hypothetical protein